MDSKADVVVGICHQPLTQDNGMGEMFCRQLGEILRLFALILLEDFNFPDINW